MAVLYPRYIQYGAAAERIPVELETAEPELVILGGILKLVRRGLKGVDTAVFSLIGHQKNAFLLNRFENGLEMLPVVGGTIGVPVPVAVIAVKIILTVKGGKTVPFPGQKFQLSVCEKQLETGVLHQGFQPCFLEVRKRDGGNGVFQTGRKGMFVLFLQKGPCAVRQFGDNGQGAFLESVSTAYIIHVLPGYGAVPGFIQYVADHIVITAVYL